MRRLARVDDNQKAIVAQLRQCGCSVIHLHTLGKNVPDICVGYQGKNILLEIKRPELKRLKPDNKNETQRIADQKNWIAQWPGPAAMVHTFDEAWMFVSRGVTPEALAKAEQMRKEFEVDG